MKLNDTKCKNLKPTNKTQKISDGQGLYLMVSPSGSKIWHFIYRYQGKPSTISFGKYPAISLFEARRLGMQAHEQLAKGLNPSAVRKTEKQAQSTATENSFYHVALRWKALKSSKVSKRTLKTVWQQLERHIFPNLNNISICHITRQDLLSILRKLEEQAKHETVKKLIQACSQIFEYAVNEGLIESNPTFRLGRVLHSPQVTHRHCIPAAEFPKLLEKISQTAPAQYFQTYAAITLLMHTFVRTVELIEATWDEFNLEDKMWVIPAARMKMRNEHRVPLSNQVVTILKELKKRFPNSKWVLPSPNGHQKHVSNNIVLNYLKRLGYKGRMTGHGFRSLAASISTEKLSFNPVVVDRQLAHQEADKTRAAYFRADFMEDRKKLMQEWSDYIQNAAPVATTLGKKKA